MDPDPKQIARAAGVGAQCVELYTEAYAVAAGGPDHDAVLDRFVEAAAAARAAGLLINAGHDLNLTNLGPLLRAIPDIAEVSIGHALVGDALEQGLDPAVRAYLKVIADAKG